MEKHQKNIINRSAVLTFAQALSNKKEVKNRVKNGENLRAVTKEKGLKVVLPL